MVEEPPLEWELHGPGQTWGAPQFSDRMIPSLANPLDYQKGPHQQKQGEIHIHVRPKQTTVPRHGFSKLRQHSWSFPICSSFSASLFSFPGFFSHPSSPHPPPKEVTKNSNNFSFYILAPLPVPSPGLQSHGLIMKFANFWLNCISVCSPRKGRQKGRTLWPEQYILELWEHDFLKIINTKLHI